MKMAQILNIWHICGGDLRCTCCPMHIGEVFAEFGTDHFGITDQLIINFHAGAICFVTSLTNYLIQCSPS